MYKKILLEGDAATLGSYIPRNTDFSAAAMGSSSLSARADHKHDVPEPLVTQLGAVNGGAASLGTSNTFVRGDHKHPMGTLVNHMHFGGFQAQNVLLEKLGSNPPSAQARIYFSTVSGHAYIDNGL